MQGNKDKEEIFDTEEVFFEDDEDEEVDWIKYHTISERLYLNSDDCPNVDYYWARGWSNDDDEFFRADAEEFLWHRTYRQFPTRYRLAEFRLSKSLRRVRNRNRDLQTIVRPLRVTPAKAELYEKHFLRLEDKVYEKLEDKYKYIKYNLTQLMETCAFLGNKLVACSIFQVGNHAIFSNNAFWDLDYPKRSLGILTVLLEMQYAAKTGMKFYYLGPFYKENSNYHYKTRFPGLEFYDWDNDVWVDKKDARDLLNQKLSFHYIRENSDFYLCMFDGVAQGREDIVAAAIVGEHARDEKREELDYKVLYLTTDISKREAEKRLPGFFGSPRTVKFEKKGGALTIRAFYKNDGEFEFNFVPAAWANKKRVDETLRLLIANGMKIMYDPQGILEKLQKTVSAKGKKNRKSK